MSEENSGTGSIAKALGVPKVGLRYEDGGKVQVLTIPGQPDRRFPGEFHNWDIVNALKAGS
jgi:hypothetical protein